MWCALSFCRKFSFLKSRVCHWEIAYQKSYVYFLERRGAYAPYYATCMATPLAVWTPSWCRTVIGHQRRRCFIWSVTPTASALQLCDIWMIKHLFIQTSYVHVYLYCWVEIMSSTNKKLLRRWDSERELYLRRHRTRALQNTIDSCINSARDRRGYVLDRRFTKVREIT